MKIFGIAMALFIMSLLFSGCTGHAKAINDTAIITEAAASDVIRSAGLLKADIADCDYGEIAYQYLAYIQEILPGRIAHTQKEREAAVFLVSALLDMGYTSDCIQVQPFSSGQGSYNENDQYDGGAEIENSQNIIVTKKGTSEKVIAVGAHYDSVGTHGVDDNGSGVAVVLENAMRLVDTQTSYTIQYIFFGHEESQMSGSNFYIKSLSNAEKSKIVAMVNLDSLIAGDTCYVSGGTLRDDGTVIHDWAAVQAYEYAQDLGVDIRWRPEALSYSPSPSEWKLDIPFVRQIIADYVPFSENGIPTIECDAVTIDGDKLFEAEGFGNIMHTSNDDLDFINAEFPGRAQKALKAYAMLTEHVVKNLKIR